MLDKILSLIDLPEHQFCIDKIEIGDAIFCELDVLDHEYIHSTKTLMTQEIKFHMIHIRDKFEEINSEVKVHINDDAYDFYIFVSWDEDLISLILKYQVADQLLEDIYDILSDPDNWAEDYSKGRMK